jgi:hypothetical protein
VNIEWQYRKFAMFLESNQVNYSAINSAHVIRTRLAKELNVETDALAMGISDTTPSALLIVEELVEEKSNKCPLHLLGLVQSYCCGLRASTRNGVKLYFEKGKVIVDSVTNLSKFFLSAKRKLRLKPYLVKCGLNEKLKVQLSLETQPTSVLVMIQHLFKLKPAIDAYMKDADDSREVDELNHI